MSAYAGARQRCFETHLWCRKGRAGVEAVCTVLIVVISSYFFGLMRHVYLSLGQEGLRHMTQNRKRHFTEIYSFPQFV